MAKLTNMKPRLATLSSRLASTSSLAGNEAARFQERDRSVQWRKWYYTRRWKALRKAVLLRDAYTCQKTGVICDGKYPAGNSPVADHKRPHRGDEVLFWNPDNIETVSKAYHDSQKQREERSGAW